jgi:EAL domain-containing protein (putative c-di-GMP-specific phosphodiesterase class I)
VFAGNVAQFPSAAPIAAPAAPAVPTAASSVSSGSTTTSKALTGTSKALSSTDTSKAAGATTTSRVLALPDGVSLILEVLPFSKLRAGGRTRRYEVLARSSHPNRVPQGFDKIALQQLLAWMGTNRSAWSLEPTSFTLNLSIATLEDERFPQFVASQLKANGIAPDNIGFEIAEPLCLQRRAQVERFITLCDKLGCFVVIDDFSLDSSITGLLRSKALRLVKIDPKLTSVALKDKLAQAIVVAIAQAVKVLGIHCAAKRVESQASLQWLTAIGCDFAQGSALGQVQSLESLATQPAPGLSSLT